MKKFFSLLFSIALLSCFACIPPTEVEPEKPLSSLVEHCCDAPIITTPNDINLDVSSLAHHDFSIEPSEYQLSNYSQLKYFTMYKYIGPDYKICVITPDGKKAKPKDWTDKQIDSATTKWPELKAWFEIISKPKVEEAKATSQTK